MRILKILAAVLVVSLCSLAHAGDKLTISAAASLKDALTEVCDAFKKAHPGSALDPIYTASGKAVTQIEQGLPVDLFFAADMEFPQKLVDKGLAAGPVKPFVRGRLVLWSASIPQKDLSFEILTTPTVQKIAVANPRQAPYGTRAVESLKAKGIYGQVESKLVYGDSISQTATYASTGAAQAGFLALSLALAPDLKGKGSYILVPDSLHQPLTQGFVVLKRAQGGALAQQFADYVLSRPAQAIFAKYGFSAPTK